MEVIKFEKDKCKACEQLQPKLEKVADEEDVEIEYVDIEEEKDKVIENGIRAAPTVVVREDGSEVGRMAGNKDEDRVRELLSQ